MTKNLNDDDLRPVSGGGGGAQDLDRSPNPSDKPDTTNPMGGGDSNVSGGGTEDQLQERDDKL